MSAVRVRVSTDGTVQGLWTDRIQWQLLGRMRVRRASYVEFDDARQVWTVRAGRPRCLFRRVLQSLSGRPFGEVLYRAITREDALNWEQAYYGFGGPGWQELAQIRRFG